MANNVKRVSLSQLRKKAVKIRVTALFSEEQYRALVYLMEKRDNDSASRIIGESVVFAHKCGMYDEPYTRKGEQKVKEVTPDKSKLCEMYGGVSDGVNCAYKKYEITAGGNVIRNEVTMPLRSMPDNEADFRKSVLAGFVTLNEAELAFENQRDDDYMFDVSELQGRRAK